jgi:hypothetical protein
MAEMVTLAEGVAAVVHDGDTVAMEGFTHLIPFAAGHEVIRQGRRDLVGEDRSAGGVRDRTGPEPPMLTRLLTGRATTPRDERVQDGTTLWRPPSVKAWWYRPREDRPAHCVGNLVPEGAVVGHCGPAVLYRAGRGQGRAA